MDTQITERCPKCDQLANDCVCYPSLAQWLGFGRQRGWISAIVCETHGDVPMSEEELAEFEAGNDPCISVIRFYTNPERKPA